MDDPVGLLQQLGFGEYEARAYAALLQRSPITGYELAKMSGIPRANVYAVLQKLEERNAVLRVEGPEGTRYAPVPPAELMERLNNRFEHILEAARLSLDAIAVPAEHEYVWNIRGYSALIEHASALIDAAQEHLLVAVWPEEARAVAERLALAEARGVAVTTLCLAVCPKECGGCRGSIYRYRVAPEERNRWLVLVPDGAEVLASEISSGEETLAVRTHQRLLVDLAFWYIRHSIALAAVLTDLGDRLPHLLDAETRAILESLGPDGGWLEHMRALLSQGGSAPAA